MSLLQNNAGTPQVNNPEVSVELTDGATLTWTDVSAWNNLEGGFHPGETFFVNRASDPLDTFFTVTTANPNDLVTIDFFGAIFRDALIVIDGNSTIVNPTSNNFAWTNVATDLVGSVTGELLENSFDEGNIGAARITITPAAIPEPANSALLGLGVCTAVLRRRRRKM